MVSNMSKDMQRYFDSIQSYLKKAYKLASSARSKGFDHTTKVEIALAKSLAERVVGIVSIAVPQLSDVQGKIVKHIEELEKKFGKLNPSVAFNLAYDVASGKFCKFEDIIKAIEAGVRIGFAYLTLGLVSSPLEGFVNIELQKTLDNKDYFTVYYAGPIRNAGGTAAAFSVLLTDYLRKRFGFAEYDPTEDEVQRAWIELEDYHKRVTNLQYFPSREEVEFLLRHLPVQIAGEPSEKLEVSNYKDMPRVKTNRLRNGFCLVIAECLALKAPKLWNWLLINGKQYELDHWEFLKEFLDIQKKARTGKTTITNNTAVSNTAVSGEDAVQPDFNYLKDLVAGRPVLSHPSVFGGFRLRYGRTRTSGYSSQALNPATMHILNGFIATGTQLKVERPGKATAITLCDTIKGPIVRLKDGSVLKVNIEDLAKKVKKQVDEIIYLGDLLISYGDFYNRSHLLMPAGYCEEWWALELERHLTQKFGTDYEKAVDVLGVTLESIKKLISNPLIVKPSLPVVVAMSKHLGVPLHPDYIFFWKAITLEQLKSLLKSLKKARFEYSNKSIKKLIIPLERYSTAKRCLELLGVEHQYINNEFVVITDDAMPLLLNLGLINKSKIENVDLNNLNFILEKLNTAIQAKEDNTLSVINKLSSFSVKDLAGSFIGARMGRPEKAKPRRMEGSPNMLFPVGKQGGRMRSFNDANEITADFKIYYCDNCKKEVVLPICEYCHKRARPVKYCPKCGYVDDCEHNPISFRRKTIQTKQIIQALRDINGFMPELIKGVRGTNNKEHVSEHPIKGVFRARYELPVNKDGTIRFDASELVITHFKPEEIGTSVEQLRSLGYTKDVYGNNLENSDQLLELKPQDVILPASPASPDERADEFFARVANFIDELLLKAYKEKPFYNLKTKKDLIGHFVIIIAPHTSVGVVSRILGFSKTQGLYAHPMLHAGIRRDADGDEASVFLLMDGLLNFSKEYLPTSRGSTMDAPIVINPMLNPGEVDDMLLDMDIARRYPLQFYEAAMKYEEPSVVKIKQVRHVLGSENQYENYAFTHINKNINNGVLCSAYKVLPTMEEKLASQMDLARKIRAVDKADVARLVIEKHFLRDTKGNLRKFSMQQFRCVNCNAKFRRPPLNGKCPYCNGRIIFTISEGSIIKYLDFSLKLAMQDGIDPYLVQTIKLLKERIEGVFGREQEQQTGLSAFIKG